MIEDYNFGSIVINGETYNHDVQVFWTDQVFDWRRNDSHVIDVEDVIDVVEQKPESIVIGTGESGMAKVTEGVCFPLGRAAAFRTNGIYKLF